MQRSVGQRVHWTNLLLERRYIMQAGKQQVLVKVEHVYQQKGEVKVLIEDGSIRSMKLNANIGKGSEFFADADTFTFYEPQI